MKRLTFLLAVIFALTSLNLVAFAGTPDKSPNLPPKRTQSTTPKTPTTVTVPADVKPVKFYKATVGKTYRLPADVRKTGDTYQTSNSAVLTVGETTGRFKSVSDGVAYIIATNGTAKRYIKVTVGTGTTEAQQKPTASTGKSALAGRDVTVTDKTTVAVGFKGVDGGKKMVFHSVSGKELGSISRETYFAVDDIGVAKGLYTYAEHDKGEDWIAEQFNIYRGVNSGGVSALEEATKKDITGYTTQLQSLINEKRAEQGIPQLTYDPSMQALANTRAKELENKFSHTRPNGTTVMDVQKYAEIIAKGRSFPQRAFDSFAASPRHNDIMMSERYSYFAAGCTIADNGDVNWVVLFSW